MAITFRNLKEEAITHPEMDTNLASYYLSSSVSGNTITFFQSGSDGNVISTSHNLADSDAQTLSIVGDQLTISNGNTVTVPTGSDTTYTEGTGIDITNEVITNTAPDQEVTLTQGGATTITGTYPNFTISSTDTDTTYTNLSEFTNDVGYITSSIGTLYTAGTGLTLTGTEFSLTEPHFSGNYNDLTNQPTIPTVPTNVSAFTNDVGYITSSLGTLYTAGTGLTLTGTEFSLTDPHFDGDYTSLTNQPTIPTVPTNVSAFTNDIGYITSSVGTLYTAGTGLTLSGAEFSLTDPHFSGNYNDLTNKPTVGLSLVTNSLTLTKLDGTTDIVDLTPYLDEDARAIESGTLDSITGIVTFTRDDASTFTLDLSDLLDDTNLVTSVNGFNGVVTLTTDDVPEGATNLYDKPVSITGQNITINGTYPNFQLTGSNGSVTSVNGQTGDVTLTLFDGDYNSLSSLPILFDGDYNSLTNQPTIPTVPTNVSAFTNDAGYITGFTEIDTLATVVARGSTTPNSITAANFITTSDRRLKSDIEPLKDGLDTIKKFVSYEYTKGGVQDAGFMAQEVQQAIPYAIAEGEDGFLTMRDRPVLAYMHKAILELEARLAAIEEKLQ